MPIRSEGLKVESEVPLKVYYHKQIIGEYYLDIIVDEKIIGEVKAVKDTIPIHEVQLLNYLKATGLEIGLLINFGYSVVVKRKIFKKPG